MNYIIFATADWDEPYWKDKQHVAVNLAGHGNKILYIERMGLRKKDISQIMKKVDRVSCLLSRGNQVNSSINVLSPLVIPNKFSKEHIRLINLKIPEFSIKASLGSKRFKKAIVLTYHLYMTDIAWCPKIESMIYDCGDKIAGDPGVGRKNLVKKREKLKKKRKVIFVTNRYFEVEGLKRLDNLDYLPNMVDNEHFVRARSTDIPESILNIKDPRLICRKILRKFRVDHKLLEEISMRKQGWNIILKEKEREGKDNKIVKRLIRRGNVNALGYRSYQELPIYLQHMRVALLPLLINKNTNNMFPLKFFEYITADLKVIYTKMVYAKNHNKGISTTSSKRDYIKKARKLLKDDKHRVNKLLTSVGSNRLADRKRIVYKLNEEYL